MDVEHAQHDSVREALDDGHRRNDGAPCRRRRSRSRTRADISAPIGWNTTSADGDACPRARTAQTRIRCRAATTGRTSRSTIRWAKSSAKAMTRRPTTRASRGARTSASLARLHTTCRAASSGAVRFPRRDRAGLAEEELFGACRTVARIRTIQSTRRWPTSKQLQSLVLATTVGTVVSSGTRGRRSRRHGRVHAARLRSRLRRARVFAASASALDATITVGAGHNAAASARHHARLRGGHVSGRAPRWRGARDGH